MHTMFTILLVLAVYFQTPVVVCDIVCNLVNYVVVVIKVHVVLRIFCSSF